MSYANFKTTSEATLVKGLFKTDVFKVSFFNFIVDQWNSLLLDFRTFEHFHHLRTLLINFILINLTWIRIDFYNWLIIYCHNISHYLSKRIIFYVNITYICLNSHMQSTLSLRKDQHFVLCPRTLTGKRWLMTWKNFKGESIMPFTSTEEMLKTTRIQ